MMNALQFLQKVLPSFNGDSGRITIVGQSTGATMVRALLATPSASALFESASIHSDPMVSELAYVWIIHRLGSLVGLRIFNDQNLRST
jgi:carboxylesterase type B